MRVNAAEGVLNTLGLHTVSKISAAQMQRPAVAPVPPAAAEDPDPQAPLAVSVPRAAEIPPVVSEAAFPDIVRTPPEAGAPAGTAAAASSSDSGIPITSNWSLTVGFEYDSRELRPESTQNRDNGWAIGAIAARPLSADRFVFGYATYRDQQWLEGDTNTVRYDRGADVAVGYGQYLNPNTVASVSLGTDGFRARLTQVF